MITIKSGKLDLPKSDIDDLKKCLTGILGVEPEEPFVMAILEGIVKYGLFHLEHEDICSVCGKEKKGIITFSRIRNKAIFICSDCSKE